MEYKNLIHHDIFLKKHTTNIITNTKYILIIFCIPNTCAHEKYKASCTWLWNKSIRCTIAILISTVLMLCLCYYNVSVIKLLKEAEMHGLHATVFIFSFILSYIPGNATNIDIYNTNHIYKNIKFIFRRQRGSI